MQKMKSKSKTTKILQNLTTLGAGLYLLFIALIIFNDSYPIFNPFGLEEALLFVFIVGFALSWMNKKMATGIILLIWNAGVWITTLYFVERQDDYAMASAIASYFMVLGAFFLLEWYKTSKATVPSKQQQWKFILRVLLINYAVLYAIVVFSELTVGEAVNYLSFPFIIYPLLLFVFFIGFLFSWIKEIFAGYVFLFWFAILLFSNIAFSDILHLGPWAAYGIPILLQGIFYIKNHNKFRSK
jgi:hypothetical protein